MTRTVQHIGPVFLFLGVLACCLLFQQCDTADYTDLSGSWGYRLDPVNAGVEEGWMHQEFEQKLQLPGTLAGNGIGEDVSARTPWIGKIIDSALWFDAKYEAYRSDGKYRVPFWLAPEKFYTGPAWYQREIVIPEGWMDKQLQLELELCHWFTDAWIDTVYLGQRNSLSTPHRYTLPETILPGRYRLTLRIDNSYLIPMGINAHSVSDNTQGNWNGVAGDMILRALPKVFIQDMQIWPDLSNQQVIVKMRIDNLTGRPFKGSLVFTARSENTAKVHEIEPVSFDIVVDEGGGEFEFPVRMGEGHLTWSEWDPAIYRMNAVLGNREMQSALAADFGMREFTTEGTGFMINGEPLFLRGTLECSIFPIEGHPPAEMDAWIRIFNTMRDHGLNHMRFHSYCPPKAAFEAADRMGIYLQVEAGGWATQGLNLGDGTAMDAYILEESERIVREFGNHPSFCMMAYGNEADGPKAVSYLTDYVEHWKERDDRRVYTSSAGWPVTSENQFFSTLQGRVQQWTDRGSTYYIEDHPPTTDFDFEDIIGNYAGPFVSHEPGQWCVYPDFREIERYTGVYRAGNFELFRSELEEKGMLHQAGDFLMASGRLQTLCYKAEIEAALRTRGLGGFQLLDLHDFPGQGTALVGVLNAMWGEKGYVSPEEYRQFCDTTVLLASIPSLVLTTADHLHAEIEVSHFGSAPLSPGVISWEVADRTGQPVAEDSMRFGVLHRQNGNHIGEIVLPLQDIAAPEMYILKLSLNGSSVTNSWELFVFPDKLPVSVTNEDIYYCHEPDDKSRTILEEGGTVWFDLYQHLKEEFTAKSGFTPVYWNTLTFNSQPIHTMGILCDPNHPLFEDFPTQMHSNWQWWDILTGSRAMVLDDMEVSMPVVQMIDSYHSNRKLGMVVEGRCGKGKVLVTSIDFEEGIDNRPATRQLRHSIEQYITSGDFRPDDEISLEQILRMIE